MNFTKRQKSKKVIGGRIFDEKTCDSVSSHRFAGFFSKSAQKANAKRSRND